MTTYLTNPKEHDPNEFIYIAHSVQGNKPKNLDISDIVSHIRDPAEFYSASLIGRSKARLVRKFGWTHLPEFCQTGTHTFVGLLIAPQTEGNVYVAWNCDLGSPTNQDELRDFAQKNRGKKRPLYQLLNNSLGSGRDFKYNELVVRGDPDSVVGVFYNSIPGNRDFRAEGETVLKDVVGLLGREVPLVEIPRTLASSDEDPLEKMVKDTSHDAAIGECLREFREMESPHSPLHYFLEDGDPELVRKLLQSLRL